uniref:Uncharacterized protein n=1 Tax=Fagus sylvatica TaxID=28930 RepID=A0A2N9H0S6_FAGSY
MTPGMEKLSDSPCCGTTSREPKLSFAQVHNFKEEGITGFPATPRTSKTDVGSYVNRAHEN